ncbi:ABC transporter substrate-binding protein [Arhodomonas sp. AD133]|uniref:ABC transporter substrate-binding protein n=1 Tax=Arhodomonas sp. AD133 TaxID=3415009 RepID=UPI003EBFE5C6
MRNSTLSVGAICSTIAVALAVGLTGITSATAASAPVRFAIQSWPGVTVKTEVATQLLNAMGYETEVTDLSSQFIYQGIRSGDVDVSLGAWMPAHESMLQPMLDDGAAVQYAANLEGAVQGLAVPAYVWESGVHSVDDLVAAGERFGREIYAIEAGAGMTRAFNEAVASGYKGLGAWSVTSSSVAGMLSQVERAVKNSEPIVFHGWKPHWMDVKFDIRFLEDGDASEIADLETTVYTVVASGWPERNPQAARFLERYSVSTDTQSRWIYGFTYEERAKETVARDWIAANLDTVEQWLDGVEAADGRPGIDAVRAAFD